MLHVSPSVREYFFGSLFILFCTSTCKQSSFETSDESGEQSQEDFVVPKTSAQTERTAADLDYLQKNAAFFFRIWNQTFTRRLDDLPMSGEVSPDRTPWSGGYYPERGGGTDVVVFGNKSPLAKYDEAFHGGQNKAVAWEREKHANGPSWAGHCNGFGAASTRHPKEPARSVTQNGVIFAPQDVKALLAEIYMSADYEFLGGNRCERAGNPPSDRLTNPDGVADPTVMDPCEDINPATLHAAVTNWVGRMRYPMVMDQAADEQVWNFPLYKYQVLKKELIPESLARQYVSGSGGDYVWNPQAAKFALIQMRLTYAQALANEVLGQLYPKDLDLTYVLELTSEGDIVGGEWVGAQSQKAHPDFIWVALEPATPNGTRFLGNPHVNAKEVLKLWAMSAGLDPENPPPTLKRPKGAESWGNWSSFAVTIDGNTRGAVFAGKKVKLRIKRKNGLLGSGFMLETSLNGQGASTVTTKGDEEIVVDLNPGPGLSRLDFVWKKDGNLVDSRSLTFYSVL